MQEAAAQACGRPAAAGRSPSGMEKGKTEPMTSTPWRRWASCCALTSSLQGTTSLSLDWQRVVALPARGFEDQGAAEDGRGRISTLSTMHELGERCAATVLRHGAAGRRGPVRPVVCRGRSGS